MSLITPEVSGCSASKGDAVADTANGLTSEVEKQQTKPLSEAAQALGIVVVSRVDQLTDKSSDFIAVWNQRTDCWNAYRRHLYDEDLYVICFESYQGMGEMELLDPSGENSFFKRPGYDQDDIEHLIASGLIVTLPTGTTRKYEIVGTSLLALAATPGMKLVTAGALNPGEEFYILNLNGRLESDTNAFRLHKDVPVLVMQGNASPTSTEN